MEKEENFNVIEMCDLIDTIKGFFIKSDYFNHYECKRSKYSFIGTNQCMNVIDLEFEHDLKLIKVSIYFSTDKIGEKKLTKLYKFKYSFMSTDCDKGYLDSDIEILFNFKEYLKTLKPCAILFAYWTDENGVVHYE